jgi:malonyl CoA-acyl carrier protein transacylase
MGEALFQRYPDLIVQADQLLGYSIRELCTKDPRGILNSTEYTQPALYVVGALSYLDWLEQENLKPDYVAGHSLGEYCALFAAGAFDFVTGLGLVKKRGELMSRAPKGAMAAILNLEQEQIEAILAGLPYRNIDIANINCRRQCILSGVYDEIAAEDLRDAFLAAGAKVIPLNVSAAFHSRCMKGVEAEFSNFLSVHRFGALKISVVSNYTGRPYPATNYANLLRMQISHSVRWFESVSWLITQGCGNFKELGAGDVLTKLHAKISQDPLVLQPEVAAGSAKKIRYEEKPRTKLIFMYGGQGSQYFQMGRELFESHPAFQKAMHRCDKEASAVSSISLISKLYGDERQGQPFADVGHTNAALYAIGYALTETLIAEGFKPDGVLGHSLGEYVAAAVAGAMDWRDGLSLVIRQAVLLEFASCRGGLLSVLASSDLYTRRQELFAHLTLAGVNYDGNFLVSGDSAALDLAQSRLENEGYIAIRLPVEIAFHASHIDHIKNEFLAAARLNVRQPDLPIYSSTRGRELDATWLENSETYFWDVVRERIRFEELMNNAFSDQTGYFFVDLSASGSFANFFKKGYADRYRCKSVINQFGNNRASLNALKSELTSLC